MRDATFRRNTPSSAVWAIKSTTRLPWLDFDPQGTRWHILAAGARRSVHDVLMIAKPERASAYILGGIATVEGLWVAANFAVNPGGFLRFLGFAPGRLGAPTAWVLSMLVVVIFVGISVRLPSVRANLFRLTSLKLLGLAVAVASGILEEAIFRKLLMDYVQARGYGVAGQIVASGVAFGVAHGVWGLMAKNFRAAAAASVATGALGWMLAVIYIVGGRSVAPCVVTHFLINALIEPGLVLAAARGEMGKGTRLA